ILMIFSAGVLWGAPQDPTRAPQLNAADFRRWAAVALSLVGYNPYANLNEADVSPRPLRWSGRDDDLLQVQGARLDEAGLRYAQAYRSFLVNAHMWRAQLTGAYLSEADLRGANLRQANLSRAFLDRAKLYRALLARADLSGANLTAADLR